MIPVIGAFLAAFVSDERGEVSWKWLAIGVLVGAGVVVLLAVGGLIKFLISRGVSLYFRGRVVPRPRAAGVS